jgi:hypothetical protein
VAEELQRRLEREFKDLRVISVTGKDSEDERQSSVNELNRYQRRVLVATDCLSEGINLQESFNAALHYDLPWNPNRLEQREGRVDRFGQMAKTVKTILFYGRDNPVDGAVLDVLLRKAKEIHRDLGITVPVPMDSETIMEAVLKTLFFRAPQAPQIQQLNLFEEPMVRDVHRRWEEAASREKESRTRFAQRAIKPDEVDRELRESDSVLGDPNAVKHFVLNTCQRLGVAVQPAKDGVFTIQSLDRFPEMVKTALPDEREWRVTFTTPAPENVTYLGRNHPFVSSLAQFLLEEALTRKGDARATRCGVIRSHAIDRRTSLLLMRLRFTLEEPEKTPLLAEEVFVCGFPGFPPDRIEWVSEEQVLNLLQKAKPDANISAPERQEVIDEVLGWWESLKPSLQSLIEKRAQKLLDSHRRIRSAAHIARRGLTVQPHFPPDLLGALVLLPVPKGVGR